MKLRTEPCRQCGAMDFYYRGEHSACRPCHNEACKRWLQRKATGEELPKQRPPAVILSESGKARRDAGADKVACKRGHPYTTENLRVSSQRNGKRLRRFCRVCNRDEKRIKYGIAPGKDPLKLSQLLDEEQ